jgi:predicted nuclease of predicted toxin-antitoxin system
MKILVDMNLSPSWVEVLARAGFAADHWSNLGLADAPDSDIMAFAKAQGCVVLTHDLDFGSILAATGGDKPSVIQLRTGDVSPSAVGAEVVNSILQMTAELDAGALLTIGPSKSRMRLLPLGPFGGPR